MPFMQSHKGDRKTLVRSGYHEPIKKPVTRWIFDVEAVAALQELPPCGEDAFGQSQRFVNELIAFSLGHDRGLGLNQFAQHGEIVSLEIRMGPEPRWNHDALCFRRVIENSLAFFEDL